MARVKNADNYDAKVRAAINNDAKVRAARDIEFLQRLADDDLPIGWDVQPETNKRALRNGSTKKKTEPRPKRRMVDKAKKSATVEDPAVEDEPNAFVVYNKRRINKPNTIHEPCTCTRNQICAGHRGVACMCESAPDANGSIAGLQYGCASRAQCEQLLDDFGAIPIGYGALAGGSKCLVHWVWRNQCAS